MLRSQRGPETLLGKFQLLGFETLSAACLLLVVTVTPVEPHPGGLDNKMGHYCRSDCDKWGLEQNEYHRHNRDGAYGNNKGHIFDSDGQKIGEIPPDEFDPVEPPNADDQPTQKEDSAAANPDPDDPATGEAVEAPSSTSSRRIYRVQLPDCRVLYVTENLIGTLRVPIESGRRIAITSKVLRSPPPPHCAESEDD